MEIPPPADLVSIWIGSAQFTSLDGVELVPLRVRELVRHGNNNGGACDAPADFASQIGRVCHVELLANFGCEFVLYIALLGD